jgi:hypothetical protein
MASGRLAPLFVLCTPILVANMFCSLILSCIFAIQLEKLETTAEEMLKDDPNPFAMNSIG